MEDRLKETVSAGPFEPRDVTGGRVLLTGMFGKTPERVRVNAVLSFSSSSLVRGVPPLLNVVLSIETARRLRAILCWLKWTNCDEVE
ncbi:unnamed protein product [Notodromas monacha]|uniref:Uncharacterized protein n=1 Tax=Notodromas monacha TaxID=399045 RepID=A0A7R9BHS7_9CRUS|nr:unnamed protein product [Notodromas monacha]CAG0915721.1 unnamed protein product [Notodromas monacha]